MKKKIFVTVILLFFIASLAFSIYYPSRDNFSNIKNGLENKKYSIDELELPGWYGEDGDYASMEDAQIIIKDVGTYVSSIKLSGNYTGKNTHMQIFYTTEQGEPFTPEKSKIVSWYSTGSRIYIDADIEAYSLRIDLTEQRDDELSISNIELNDRTAVFSINSIAKWCVLPTILVGIILFVALYFRGIKPYLDKFKQYMPLVTNLVSRDLKVKYRRSVLGFLWSILNPLLMALVIHTVFSRLFRFDIQYFATYYLVGSLIFNFVVECTSNALGSVISAAALIKKVYIPKYIFPFQKCVFALVNMLFGCVAVIVVMLIQGVPFHATMLLFFVPMCYAFVFAYGFGLILAAATVFFRDIQHLYSVFTAVWMYLTPIIYPEEMLLSNGLGIIMKLNPMYYYTHYLRSVVMYGTLPSLEENIMCIVFALVMLIAGNIVFKKTQDKFILHI